ncbi:plasmid mobilization protein [Pseudomonas sp. NPDC089396]|uniref:plasmid mobilization protein n=1 Tax=Pseudomonas sp. NPDC089396 TaxID=3364461 RepID=UPI00383516F9
MIDKKKDRKDKRITVRLTHGELRALETKIAEAGYRTVGAFIRDFVANLKPQVKVSGDVVLIARELMALSILVNSSAGKSDLIKKIKEIDRINTGGTL